MHTHDDTRPLRTITETRNGIPNDVVTDGTHYYPMAPTWESDAWFHAEMWDTGVCYEHEYLMDAAAELRRLQHTDIANTLHHYCHWSLVHVYLTAANPPPVNAAFLRKLTQEIEHYKHSWTKWRNENPALWASLGSHPDAES